MDLSILLTDKLSQGMSHADSFHLPGASPVATRAMMSFLYQNQLADRLDRGQGDHNERTRGEVE